LLSLALRAPIRVAAGGLPALALRARIRSCLVALLPCCLVAFLRSGEAIAQPASQPASQAGSSSQPATQPPANESTSGPGGDWILRPSSDLTRGPGAELSFERSAEPTGPTSEPTSGLVSGEEVTRHWSGLPIWGEKEAHELGYELPPPLGLSANVFSSEMNFHVPKLSVGGSGGRLLNIDNLVRVGNVKIQETASTFRLDGWVLPFLNLYAVAGYVNGQADIELRPGFLPILRSRGPKANLHLDFEGPTAGFGGTLAGGFKPFKEKPTLLFGLTDLNFTRTFLDFNPVVSYLPGVDVTVFSTRLGVRERILEHSPFGQVHASLWGGGMYQGVQDVMAGSAFHALNFRADVDAVKAWNTLVGGRLELGKHAVVTVEVGLGDRKSLMLEATFRF
jgi:hypothetical protein